jgi:exodeoxyribonuclease VII large subunit
MSINKHALRETEAVAQLQLTFEPKTYSVGELTAYLKRTLKVDPVLGGKLLVQAEVSNLKRSGRGHVYFTLKDDTASINAVMWASTVTKSKFQLEEGMALIATGELDIYAPSGSYSLVVSKVEPVGIGALQLAYQQLKERFENEGLFDVGRKRALPEFPFRIGIVTAGTGAVIHDMMRVIRAKNPIVDVVFASVKVQGEGAAEEIATAIRTLQSEKLGLEALIVGRGGGSFEDLFCFSEEPVVRAMAESRIPIVAGVGHEPDYGLADAVADYSAATPTMAADTLIPDAIQMAQLLVDSGQWMVDELGKQLLLSEDRLSQLAENLQHRFFPLYERAEMELHQQRTTLLQLTEQALQQEEERLATQELELNAYNPANILRRGYVMAQHPETKSLIHSVKQLPAKEIGVVLQFAESKVKLSNYTLDTQN